ncbi:DUF305 domain-containing protein [Rhizobium sp. SSA_523]|uniref:DUF305 domain-containing protein n=1 Tax=Rhizobium sp. SSA_523 TaxID=2952477 RepID=UPI0020915E6F|nr:DUF305 domain-containing protein [Rhizobium sp. SSA_523]MCO5733407.1 DUF305 domain-containing protein [Rhizobium sp. SSA_523]WKC21619.1 DUF305 domain-containing protein [Rhizobium sp. SSA_523]
MRYTRYAAMVAASSGTMLGLMYLNTYSFQHITFTQTRIWMALLMGATMTFLMLIFMWHMYKSKIANFAIIATALMAYSTFSWLVRSQATVSDADYMKAMIPHHSIAVLTSTGADSKDPRVRDLANRIIQAQVEEFAETKRLINSLEENPPAPDAAALPPLDADNSAPLTVAG